MTQLSSKRRPSPAFLRLAHRLWGMLGINLTACIKNVLGLPGFIRDIRKYESSNSRPHFAVRLKHLFPILYERKASAGSIGGDYFHQDLWAARRIYRRKPASHIDIGSRIDGFVAHVLTFMDITLIDIRSIQSNLEGLTFIQDDATTLANIPSDSVESLSTLHVAEHFGLGRYGDPISAESCFTYMNTLQRVLAPGGVLYFSVPIGEERVEFNAHRVFSPSTILQAFSGLKLLSFSYVNEDGSIYENVDPYRVPDGWYMCGLFEFAKP